MYRVELAKAFHRWRTWLLAAAIGGIPVVIVFALKVSPPIRARPRTRRRSCSRSRPTASSRR